MIKLIAMAVALGGVGVVVKTQLPELRRYLKVTKM
jgi:hypothetical protein